MTKIRGPRTVAYTGTRADSEELASARYTTSELFPEFRNGQVCVRGAGGRQRQMP